MRGTGLPFRAFLLPPSLFAPATQPNSERMQLVYEFILVNKILRKHLLSENMQ